MKGQNIIFGTALSAILLSGVPLMSGAQHVLRHPYRMSVLSSATHDHIFIRLAHDFPGFVQMRLVYAYFDGGSMIHKFSVFLQGYHKVWSLRPLPAAAEKLQFLSFSIQYGDYILRCEENADYAVLLKNGQVLDTAIAFNRRPLDTPIVVHAAHPTAHD